jgi:hypothetical protein
MPEFYADNTFHVYATLERKDPDNEYNDRTVYVGVNGEMDLVIPNLINGELSDDEGTRIRYGNDFAAAFKDDIQFWQFLKVMGNAGWEVYRQNPWWEIWSDDYPDGEVFDTFYEAVDGAISFINDDEYWEQY